MWSEWTQAKRADVLRRAVALFHANEKELAVLLTKEQGKPLREATLEIRRFAQVRHWNDTEAADHRRFGRVLRRNENPFASIGTRAQCNGQNSFHRPNCPRQCQLADNDKIFQLLGFDLLGGGDHADRNRQIERPQGAELRNDLRVLLPALSKA